jgi:hypothetical protein
MQPYYASTASIINRSGAVITVISTMHRLLTNRSHSLLLFILFDQQLLTIGTTLKGSNQINTVTPDKTGHYSYYAHCSSSSAIV